MSKCFFLHLFQSTGQNDHIRRGPGYPPKGIPHHNIDSVRKYHRLWKPSVHTKFSHIFCLEITLILGPCPFPVRTFFQLRQLICRRLLCSLRDQGRIPAGIQRIHQSRSAHGRQAFSPTGFHNLNIPSLFFLARPETCFSARIPARAATPE